MDLTTFDQVGQASQEVVAIDPASLYQAFEQVKDRRGRKGRRENRNCLRYDRFTKEKGKR